MPLRRDRKPRARRGVGSFVSALLRRLAHDGRAEALRHDAVGKDALLLSQRHGRLLRGRPDLARERAHIGRRRVGPPLAHRGDPRWAVCVRCPRGQQGAARREDSGDVPSPRSRRRPVGTRPPLRAWQRRRPAVRRQRRRRCAALPREGDAPDDAQSGVDEPRRHARRRQGPDQAEREAHRRQHARQRDPHEGRLERRPGDAAAAGRLSVAEQYGADFREVGGRRWRQVRLSRGRRRRG